MHSTTALLVIDMQYGLVTGAHCESAVLETVNMVIRKFRQAEMPVFFIQHNHSSFEPLMKGAKGWQLIHHY